MRQDCRPVASLVQASLNLRGVGDPTREPVQGNQLTRADRTPVKEDLPGSVPNVYGTLPTRRCQRDIVMIEAFIPVVNRTIDDQTCRSGLIVADKKNDRLAEVRVLKLPGSYNEAPSLELRFYIWVGFYVYGPARYWDIASYRN